MNTLFRIMNARVALVCAMMASPALALSTPGKVDLRATINDLGAKSGANHDVVVWVTSSTGTFIKTLWKQGDTTTMSATGGDWDHFATWNTARNGSTAFDGYSSATATSYAATGTSPPTDGTRASNPIHVIWNCRNASNVIVPDGTYHFYIQYAESISSPLNGPVTNALVWTKGPGVSSATPPNQGTLSSPSGGYNFTNIAITWTPDVPEIAVEQPAGTNLIDGSSNIPFGSVSLGSSSTAFIFTVKNTGTDGLTLANPIGKDGPHAADFAVSAIATSVAAGASTTFSVTFTPGAAGIRTAAIHIANNDSDESMFDITLTGTGLSAYESWAKAAGLSQGQADPMQTPRNDGVTNLEKFAFNMNPSIPDVRMLTVGASGTAGLPGATLAGGRLRIEFVRRKAATSPGISYTPQFCSGFDIWEDFTGSPVSVTSINSTWERVVVDDPAAGTGKRFGRLKLVQP